MKKMDPEVLAMKRIARALEPLDPEARKRALEWAVDRYVTHAKPQAHCPESCLGWPAVPGGPCAGGRA